VRERECDLVKEIMNCIHEEMKSSLNSGNYCYQAVQNPSVFLTVSKNVHIKILPVLFMDVKIKFHPKKRI